MNKPEIFFDMIDESLNSIEDINVYYKTDIIPARKGEYLTADNLNINDGLKKFIGQKYSKGLYHHQYKAVEKFTRGENILATTQTASGKSLIYSIPVFNEILNDPDSTALLIYPQKALANDQLKSLKETWQRLMGEDNLHFKVSRYDGSVENGLRGEIKKHGQVILTNPDMLHVGMLNWHKQWERFFRNLKVVVIDEVHEYTGAFGGNVAYLLRRLRSICKYYNSSPKFISTSATIRNPEEHIKKLTGLHFSIIPGSEDTSASGAKKYYLVGTDEQHQYDLIKNLILKYKEMGLSTLVFCPSRKTAEKLGAQQRKGIEEGWLAVYRSGLKAEERQKVEEGLKSGKIKTVFSTNALELGIDIGALDVVICIGIPSTKMSLVQRSGRIGRVNKPGAVIIIPSETPIDSFYANNPEILFERDLETVNLTLNNKRLAHRHAACALYEMGNDIEILNYEILGENIKDAIDEYITGRNNNYEYNSTSPHMLVSIRGNFSGQYEIKLNGSAIGSIDSYHLLREAFPYAVYYHGGKPFEVQSVLQQGNREVRVVNYPLHHSTTPIISTQVNRGDFIKYLDNDFIHIENSNLTITEQLVSASKKNQKGESVFCGFKPGMLNSLRFHTTGSFLHIKPKMMNELLRNFTCDELKTALAGCRRLFEQIFSTIVPNCDSQDIGCTFDIKDNNTWIYLFDRVEGGIELTTEAYENWEALIDRVISQVHDCSCFNDEGCFKCVANPDAHEKSSKQLSLRLLKSLKKRISENSFIENIAEERETELPAERTCPGCGSGVKESSNFCSNCGCKMEVNI